MWDFLDLLLLYQVAVATKFLGRIDLPESEKLSCIEMCQIFHTSTQDMSKEFLLKARRYNYVTPTSYLEMINTFEKILTEKRREILHNKKRYKGGLKSLESANEQVGKMKGTLIALQPKLIAATEDVKKVLAVIQKESVEVAEIEKIVKADEEAALVTLCSIFNVK